MENLQDFFSPVPSNIFSSVKAKDHLGNTFKKLHTDEKVTPGSVCLIGIPYINKKKSPEYTSANIIREKLYELYTPALNQVNLIDLGNIKPGNTDKDFEAAITLILSELQEAGCIAILLGNEKNLVYYTYLAYEKRKKAITLTEISNTFTIAEDKTCKENHYLSKIILRKHSKLFNYSIIGFQTYFVSAKETDLAKKLYFDTIRLGQAQQSIENCEPFIRDSHIFHIDLSSVKGSEAWGTNNPGPNGLSGSELCQLSRYAGTSDLVSSFLISGYNHCSDSQQRTAMLAAQTIWYFIEGISLRKEEFPTTKNKKFLKFTVAINEQSSLVFYKSIATERWWLEVSNPNGKKIIISCNYNDYDCASKGELPDRWWKYYQKIS